MGGILSRWKKSQTTVEVLEQIDKDIAKLEKFKRLNHESRTRVIGGLILYSVVTYVIVCVVLYFFFEPETLTDRFLQVLPLLFFPVIIYLLKRFLHWWFVRKTKMNDAQLEKLREERKEILENVMETETYKKAKEILEKFDPETKKKLEEERNRSENPVPQTPVASELRRRNVASPSTPGSRPPSQMGVVRSPVMSPNVPIPQGVIATPMYPVNGTARGPAAMPIMLPRPLLNQNRSAVDKLLEFLTGEGPSNRYALICRNCYSHNGMALREEFEYIDYRCGYCRFFNQAKKQRPTAPRLPSLPPTPRSPANESPPRAVDDVSESDASPGSSRSSQADDAPESESNPAEQPITDLVAQQPKQTDVTNDPTMQGDGAKAESKAEEDRPPEEPERCVSDSSVQNLTPADS